MACSLFAAKPLPESKYKNFIEENLYKNDTGAASCGTVSAMCEVDMLQPLKFGNG